MLLTYIWLVWSGLCCYLFHLAWWGSKKAREAPAELSEQYPWFVHPNLQTWNYYTMLLQSFTLLPIRIALYLIAHFFCGVIHASLGEVGE